MTTASAVRESWSYRLRILHISDLHERADRENETWRRHRVLGSEFDKNIDAFTAQAPVDLVFFTGDLADWGEAGEYAAAQSFVEHVIGRAKIDKSRFFLIPGNHDIHRKTEATAWAELRAAAPSSDKVAFSRWMAGTSAPPAGMKPEWRDNVLSRQANYQSWVASAFGRPDLAPTASPHGLLGYRATPSLGLPFAVHVIGLDTAWLAGDNNDSRKLCLTDDQIGKLATDVAGQNLLGLRLALMHHPISDLFDEGDAFRLLSEKVDIVFRGHLHEPALRQTTEPGANLKELVAGALYDGAQEDRYRNACQLLDLVLAPDGAIRSATVHFRSWSARGFWHSDDSLYRGSKGGSVQWIGGDAPAIGPVSRISSSGTKLIEYTGPGVLHQLAEAWGDPNEPSDARPATVIVQVDAAAPELSEALLRLGVHGGLSKLYVVRPGDWDRAASAVVACIGVLADSWKWTLDPTSSKWRILSCSDAPAIDDASTKRAAMSEEQAAADLQDAMDLWVWLRLTKLVNDVLLGDTGAMGIPIAEDIRAAMTSVWSVWELAMSADVALRRHFLLAVLTTADPVDGRAAHARLGPLTVRTCLLKAVIFALAVDLGWTLQAAPSKTLNLPVNLLFRGGIGHLMGLQLHEGAHIHSKPPCLKREPQFLLMSNCILRADDLPDARQRIGTSTNDPMRLGTVDLEFPITLTADPAFDRALGGGLAELNSYLAEIAERFVTRTRKRIEATIEGLQ